MKRRTLITISGSLLVTGCLELGSSGSTESPNSNPDLVVENKTDTQIDATITVESTGDDESFSRHETLGAAESNDRAARYPDIAVMDDECVIRVVVEGGPAGESTFSGDAVDDHRGLLVDIYPSKIKFVESVV